MRASARFRDCLVALPLAAAAVGNATALAQPGIEGPAFRTQPGRTPNMVRPGQNLEGGAYAIPVCAITEASWGTAGSNGANMFGTASPGCVQSSGTLTLDIGNGPLQYVLSNGTFNVAAPIGGGAMRLSVVNLLSAGTITPLQSGTFTNLGTWSKQSFAGSYGTGATATSTVTISNASPGIVTWGGHPMTNGGVLYLTTTGGLPAPLLVNNPYYVCNLSYGTGSFALARTRVDAILGNCINTSSAGSGTHTAYQASMYKLSIDVDIEGAYGAWTQVQ